MCVCARACVCVLSSLFTCAVIPSVCLFAYLCVCVCVCVCVCPCMLALEQPLYAVSSVRAWDWKPFEMITYELWMVVYTREWEWTSERHAKTERRRKRRERERERERRERDDEQSKKEPNSIRKGTRRGNKVIIVGEKWLLFFLTSQLFSFSPLRLLSFICKKGNCREGRHGKKN